MKRKGWWQQLQSGEYPKTKLKYADSNWAIFRSPIPKPSSNTSFPLNIQLRGLPKEKIQSKISQPDNIEEPQFTIAKIQKILKEVYDAKELHELLSFYLNKLREIYKTNNSVFSYKDIVFLKDIKNINNQLILFLKIREELVRLPIIENPGNIYFELLSLLDFLKKTAVRRRVEREIQKFLKKYPNRFY